MHWEKNRNLGEKTKKSPINETSKKLKGEIRAYYIYNTTKQLTDNRGNDILLLNENTLQQIKQKFY